MKQVTEQAIDVIDAVFTVRPSARSQERGRREPYTVTVRDGRAFCDCDGYAYRHECKHTRRCLAAVAALRESQGEQARQEPLPLAERGTLAGTRPFSLLR